jgi:hypothetical protein
VQHHRGVVRLAKITGENGARCCNSLKAQVLQLAWHGGRDWGLYSSFDAITAALHGNGSASGARRC